MLSSDLLYNEQTVWHWSSDLCGISWFQNKKYHHQLFAKLSLFSAHLNKTVLQINIVQYAWICLSMTEEYVQTIMILKTNEP